jgi:transposase-like protein
MVEEMLALRGITVSRETVRAWGLKFGPACRTEVLGCGRVSTDEQTTETLMRTTVP